MTPYETWSLFIAGAAVIIALLSFARSQQAIELSREANEIASQHLDEVARGATPELVTSCKVKSETSQYSIIFCIFNAGSDATKITEGEVRLHFDAYPEADQTRPLSGIKIAGRTPHIEEFKPRTSVMNTQRVGVRPAEIICQVIHTRPNKENGTEKVHYTYDAGKEQFVLAK